MKLIKFYKFILYLRWAFIFFAFNIFYGCKGGFAPLENDETDNKRYAIIVSSNTPVTSEAGGTFTFNLNLTSAPSADVVISVTSSNTKEGIVSPLALTFTSSNWKTLQTVTVTGVDDLLSDGDSTYFLSFTVNSIDSLFQTLVIPNITITNTDIDTTVTTSRAFNNDLNVTLREGDSAASSFRYTFNSSPPTDCDSGLSNDGTTNIIITSTSTLRSISCDEQGNPSHPRTQNFILDIDPPTVPRATVGGNVTVDTSFKGTLLVTLSESGTAASDFADFRYTLTGTPPANCASGTANTGSAISLTSTKILKAISCDSLGNASAVLTRIYTFDNTPPAAPGATADATFNPSISITLSGGSEDDFLDYRYTLDGTTPSSCSMGTSNNGTAFTLTASATLKAISCDRTGNFSAVTTRTYTLDNSAPFSPVINVPAGRFNAGFNVQLSAGGVVENFAAFHYSIDGSTPLCADGNTIAADTNIPISTSTTTVKAIACNISGTASAVTSNLYTYDNTPPAAPTMSIATRSFKPTIDISLSGGSGGDFADYRYTTTGIAPSSCSDGISNTGGEITLSATTTLKAISCDDLGNVSSVVTETYTLDITPPPVPSATAGARFNPTISVTLSGSSGGDFVDYRYTTTGTAPSSCSDGISNDGSAIVLSSTKTLKAISCDTFGNPSAAVSEDYILDTTPPFDPTVDVTDTYFSGAFNATLSSTGIDLDVDKFTFTLNNAGISCNSPTASGGVVNVTVSGAEGSNTVLRAMACDQAGNASGVLTKTYTYDLIPVPGATGAITFADIGETSLTINWTAATDSTAVQYKVVKGAAAEDIDELSEVDAITSGPDLLQDWTSGISTLAVTGLTTDVPYFFNIIVKDANEQKALYVVGNATPVVPNPCPAGFIPVPGNATLGTSDFCVMKYEAKNNGGGIPVSVEAGTAYVSLSAATIFSKCASKSESGFPGSFALISNAEWMTIARNIENVSANLSEGKLSRGWIGTSNSAPNSFPSCLYFTGGTTCSATGTAIQKRSQTLSNGEEIWDIAGNFQEYVDWSSNDGVFTGSSVVTILTWREITASSSPYTANDVAGTLGYNMSNHAGMFINVGQFIMRGGSLPGASTTNDYGGIFMFYGQGNSNGYGDRAFRCVYRP